MIARLVTGFILAPLVVWLLLAGPQLAIVAVVAVAAGLAANELVAMWRFTRPFDGALAAVLAAGVSATPFLGDPQPFMWVTLGTVAALAYTLLRPGDNLDDAARRGAIMVLAITYVGGLAGAMTAIAVGPTPLAAPGVAGPFAFGPSALLTLLAIVFLGDTGAYFAGKALGRHKLYPAISPKKTIEGSIGGLSASVAGAACCSLWLIPQVPLWEAMALGALCGSVAQVGDLAESLFKRASQTKDSGKLLPGHGGMLDRIDGVLFAAPVFWAWLQVAH